jgi:hypothetical protein
MTGLIHRTTKLVIFCFLGIGAATSTLAAPPTPISACPYTISTPGSYAVTRNLSMSSIGNCISLMAPLAGVSIDLQNHSITGSGPTDPGASAGIRCITSSGLCDNVIIVNGTISKFGEGIYLVGDGNIIAGVTASANGDGVRVLAHAGNRPNVVDGVTANGNGRDGITAGGNGTANSVSNSSADSNGGNGIFASGIVSNCEAANNGQWGLFGVLVSDSKAHNNVGDGIVTAGGYTGVLNSMATGNGGNGITAGGNTGGPAGNVVGSTAQNNAGIGIQLFCPGAAYNNIANTNTGGDIVPTDSTCELFGNKPAP